MANTDKIDRDGFLGLLRIVRGTLAGISVAGARR
jgi:hypothetical protein